MANKSTFYQGKGVVSSDNKPLPESMSDMVIGDNLSFTKFLWYGMKMSWYKSVR